MQRIAQRDSPHASVTLSDSCYQSKTPLDLALSAGTHPVYTPSDLGLPPRISDWTHQALAGSSFSLLQGPGELVLFVEQQVPLLLLAG